MFISKVLIKNFRLFNDSSTFSISDLNVPNRTNAGSGLNVFVGENGCGKTSLIDALSFPLLEYKADSVSVNDFYNPETDIEIKIFSDGVFEYDRTMPRGSKYKGKGFEFKAKVRALENRAYLSSIVVKDQRFIRAAGETKPEDNSPDIRLKVDNPWKGPRFTDNDILFLDKNRIFQIRTGTYNSTRFDRLMEDFNFKHIKNNSPMEDIDKELATKLALSENSYLKSAFDKFEEICGQKINLNLINNYLPFTNAFIGLKKANNQQIAITEIGSGYEMIFTLLYSFYLSKQSGKNLIILIDEPELHFHPKLQENFAELLLDFSKEAQIFLTTHSPLLVKQLMAIDKTLVKVLLKENNDVKESDPQDIKLSYLSANEVNFIAFQLPTEEYHNELYEELINKYATRRGIRNFDVDFFQGVKSESANYPWESSPNQVSLHTYIRNQIHHRADMGKANTGDILTSIKVMRSFL